MNIFRVDDNPIVAAQSLCDEHVVKMTTETAQILCFVHYNLGATKAPYKPNKAHLKHPATLWAGDSIENYRWLVSHGEGLAAEFSFRFLKKHASEAIIKWAKDNEPELKLFKNEHMPVPQCFGEQSQLTSDNPVDGYRKYYMFKRLNMKTGCRYLKGREKPEWLIIN